MERMAELGNMAPDEGVKSFFGTNLLAWFRKEARDLPWRRTRDPYHIWVSEIMLQQTRVETVIPYFRRFIERFPTIQDLAAAPEAEVLKLWEGLGYYSRARNLQAAARQVAERHGGAVPKDKASVSALKGIGPYTAGAILSIAFNQPEPAVDGNVMRVLSRFFCLDGDIAKPAVRAGLEKLAQELIPEGEASNFNQALMELGALVCTPRSPGCLTCPVMERCAGRLAGREQELPVKSRAKRPKPEHRLAVLVWGKGANAGKVLVRQRPEDGLLARMWELPHVEAPNASIWSSADAGPAWLAGALAAEGLHVRPLRHTADAEHVFTHLHWYVKVWEAELEGDFAPQGIGSRAVEGAGACAAAQLPDKLIHTPSAALTLTSAADIASVSGGASRLAETGGSYKAEGMGSRAAGGFADGGTRDAPASAESGDAVNGRQIATLYRWVGPAEFEQLAWPKVFRTLLGKFLDVR
jgi:A/G-specific adenine glycosylase